MAGVSLAFVVSLPHEEENQRVAFKIIGRMFFCHNPESFDITNYGINSKRTCI